MIKVIYCITKANWGGAQKYVFDLATALPKGQFQASVIVGKDGPLVEKLHAAGIETLILGDLSRDLNFWSDFVSFIKLIKIIRQKKPDILHLNSSKMGFLGSLAGRILKIKKIIFTGHGWAFNEDRPKWQKKIIYFLHLLTITLSHKTIGVSTETKRQISDNNYFQRKITVIRNGLARTDFLTKDLARGKILEKLPSELELNDRLWFGSISELHKNKGLKYIIEAMHLLKINSENPEGLPILIIIGDGEKREKLEQRIKRYHLENLVFLIGRIDEAEKYLKAFDLFTLTSITEALPYAILEAGQAGLPIVASAVGGIPEIIDDMENGILIRPKEPEEIVRAIDFLLKNPDKMVTFGRKIREKIIQDFNKEEMVKRTIELYN